MLLYDEHYKCNEFCYLITFQLSLYLTLGG